MGNCVISCELLEMEKEMLVDEIIKLNLSENEN